MYVLVCYYAYINGINQQGHMQRPIFGSAAEPYSNISLSFRELSTVGRVLMSAIVVKNTRKNLMQNSRSLSKSCLAIKLVTLGTVFVNIQYDYHMDQVSEMKQ